MSRVVRVPLRDAWKSGLSRDIDEIEAPLLLKYRHLLNPTVLATVVWAVLLVSTPFSRVSVISFFAFSGFLAALFFDLKMKAESLVITRVRGQRSVYQGERVRAGFEVHNTEASSLRVGVIVEDVFEPSRRALLSIATVLSIGPRSRIFIGEERLCDAEMGEKSLGPMRLRLRDLFGIFEFHIVDDTQTIIELLPRVKPVPEVPVVGSLSSMHYGLYEVPTRGLSVNFSGLRPFAHGDSLRHIAWRKSAKRDGLMVKEFEKVVSSDITLVLDMSPGVHVGVEAESSWEASKLVALGVAKQQLDLGNSIQFVSNDVFLSAARGTDFFSLLTRTVTHLHPSTTTCANAVIDRAEEQITAGSTLLFVTVFDAQQAERSFARLCALKDRQVQIFVMLLEPNSFLLGRGEAEAFGYLGRNKAADLLEENVARLRSAGIEVQVLRRGDAHARWFTHRKAA